MRIQRAPRYFTFFFTLWCSVYYCPTARAQDSSEELLAAADSLFTARQYTESLGLYEQLFAEQGVLTPALLLKMAFIQESTGAYSEALYYLNEYYLLTSDKAAVQKMQQLSEQYDLRGYADTDYQLFYTYFREYRYYIIYALIGLSMVGLIVMATSRRSEERPYGWGVTYLLVLGLLAWIINAPPAPRQAIIMNDHTYIMAAPSSGSKVVTIGQKGHRVPVGAQQDVWVQIEWNGEPAYVRHGNLRKITL